MNFSYGIIAIVGVLVAISIGFIAAEPDDVPEPREMSVNSHIIPKTAIAGDTLIVEVEFRDNNNNIVDHVNYDILAIQNDKIILSNPDSHRHPGMHPIHETSILGESQIEVEVTLNGLGHGDDISGPMGTTTTLIVEPEVMEEEVMEEEALPMTLTVSLPNGSGVPGCETTNECFLPYEATVATGATVIWNNDDTAAHTVTSGTVEAGLTGVFDSSIFMSGASFEFTFDEAGTYDYFCMVHPWMTGIVNVN